MLINPELRRYLWQDFSLHRLIMAPLVIGLISYIEYLSPGNFKATLAFGIACFFIFLWGTKNASEAVIEEVNHNTWDFQRQSALSPWTIAWGKLLGSSSFSWYGALICFFIYSLRHYSGTISITTELSYLLMGGLFGQTVAMLSSMQQLSTLRQEKVLKTFRHFILGAIVGSYAYLILSNISRTKEVLWFHFSFPGNSFALISVALFLGWAILGLYRSFCRELQYKTLPWAWLAFNLFFIFYLSGLTYNYLVFPREISDSISKNFDIQDIKPHLDTLPYYVAFVAANLLSYLALFMDDLSPIRYKKLFTRIQEGNLRESLQQFPWWSISAFVVIGTAFLAMIQPNFSDFFAQQGLSDNVFIMTTLLFLTRDILLFHYFAFQSKPKGTIGNVVLYLFILYFLLPMLGHLLHINWNHLFLPSGGHNTVSAVISALFQIALLAALTWRQWRKTWQGL